MAIVQAALHLLYQELEIANTTRCLNPLITEFGDYEEGHTYEVEITDSH